MMGITGSSALLAVATLVAAPLAAAQQMTSDGCMRLLGSVACPGFSNAWINPSNVSQAFPFFTGVNTVGAFDAAFFNYISSADGYRRTKFGEQLACSNASQATIRYQRTVLCSQLVNEHWSQVCTELYNASSVAMGPRMICQNDCEQFAFSENAIVQNATYCPGPDLTGGFRQGNLTKDFIQCTNWTSLATNDSATCVSGDSNEGNCGYGTSTTQLCLHCNVSSPDACCYMGTTDLSTCGYTLVAQPSSSSSSSSSATASSTSTAGAGSAASHRGLSGGQIAGIVVGSVVGGLLLIALLLALLACLGLIPLGAAAKRKREQRRQSKRSSFAAGGPQSTNNLVGGGAGGAGDTSSNLNRASAASFGATSGLGGGMGAGNMSQKSGPGTAFYSSQRTLAPNSSASWAGSSDKLGGKPGVGNGSSNGLGIGGAAAIAGVAGATGGAAALGAPGTNATAAHTPGRVLLTSMRDENQSGEHLILPNSTVTVLWPYSAALPDELSLRPGQKLTVLRIYDDGWGTGQLIESDNSRGRQGAFPLVCVTENNSTNDAFSSRGSQSGHSHSPRWSGGASQPEEAL